ncbi:uncharacterized protein [Taeniopygia guttata]|uniref:uncharacterized protein n=1 Tax=Taeniopygia guttata TaxID=59729 RepID=UPI003BB90098
MRKAGFYGSRNYRDPLERKRLRELLGHGEIPEKTRNSGNSDRKFRNPDGAKKRTSAFEDPCLFSPLPELSPTPALPDGIFRGGSGAVHRGCGVSSTASGARGGVCERRAGGGGGSGGPSLKNKLWSGNKLGALHAEESKKIQAQLKELHYGKKDLIFKESQLKALKETVQLCLCSVLRSQPPAASLISSKPAEKLPSSNAKGSQAPSQGTSTKSVRSWNGPLPQGSTGHCWAGVEITAGWDIDGGVGLETLGHELKCCRAGAEAKITPVMLEKRRAGAGRRDLAVK